MSILNKIIKYSLIFILLQQSFLFSFEPFKEIREKPSIYFEIKSFDAFKKELIGLLKEFVGEDKINQAVFTISTLGSSVLGFDPLKSEELEKQGIHPHLPIGISINIENLNLDAKADIKSIIKELLHKMYVFIPTTNSDQLLQNIETIFSFFQKGNTGQKPFKEIFKNRVYQLGETKLYITKEKKYLMLSYGVPTLKRIQNKYLKLFLDFKKQYQKNVMSMYFDPNFVKRFSNFDGSNQEIIKILIELVRGAGFYKPQLHALILRHVMTSCWLKPAVYTLGGALGIHINKKSIQILGESYYNKKQIFPILPENEKHNNKTVDIVYRDYCSVSDTPQTITNGQKDFFIKNILQYVTSAIVRLNLQDSNTAIVPLEKFLKNKDYISPYVLYLSSTGRDIITELIENKQIQNVKNNLYKIDDFYFYMKDNKISLFIATNESKIHVVHGNKKNYLNSLLNKKNVSQIIFVNLASIIKNILVSEEQKQNTNSSQVSIFLNILSKLDYIYAVSQKKNNKTIKSIIELKLK